MKINREIKFRKPLRLDEDDLKQLEIFVQESFKNISYTLRCSGGTTIQYKCAGEIAIFENPSFRKIESLEIKASNDENYFYSDDKVELVFKNHYGLYSAICNVHCTSMKTFNSFNVELSERLNSMKPWYWWLNYFPAPFILLGITLIFGSYLYYFASNHGTYEIDHNVSSNNAFDWISIVFYCLLLIVVDRVVNYFFPKVYFYIGKQVREYNFRQKILYVIFGVIGLGILINIISRSIAL